MKDREIPVVPYEEGVRTGTSPDQQINAVKEYLEGNGRKWIHADNCRAIWNCTYIIKKMDK